MPKTRKIKRSHSPLYEAYGKMVLKKGTILYHTNMRPFCKRSDKPMVFMTVHPSEWHNSNETYVAKIKLKRDVSLLFMVQEIRNTRVFSSLNLYSGNNMSKTNDENLWRYVDKLRDETFDGWFSSIENGSAVEVALINDHSVYDIVSCEPLEFNWKNTNFNNNGEMIPKQWGSLYPIGSTTYPIELDLNERFKDKIERYIETMQRNEPYGTALSILFDNAKIKYHPGKMHNIKW